MLPTDPSKRLSFKRSVSDVYLVIVYERHDNMKAIKVCESTQIESGNPLVPRFLATTVVPRCLVLELGTGSGSLTNSFARAVAPSGHVYTYDFHEQRAASAREDFERTGLSSLVTMGLRDIQGEVFPNEFTGKADSIFLDLPQPWLAIPSVGKMLKQYGILRSFSPCIEQDSYMVVSDDRQIVMPTFEDMQSGTPLAYPASERSSIRDVFLEKRTSFPVNFLRFWASFVSPEKLGIAVNDDRRHGIVVLCLGRGQNADRRVNETLKKKTSDP
ncbi:hypothetical protein AgCh_009128 [Apium graveolens]